MSRRIEHRARYSQPVNVVYPVLVDPEYLRARLKEIGGREAALLEHEAADGSAKYHIRHSLDARHLPSAVRAALGGDLTIDRVEQWRGHTGTAQVTVPKTPAKLTADLALTDSGDGSELTMQGTVTVSIPLVGGKIEETIVRYVCELLDSERDFTERWLAG
jgi:hypothetical protein